MHIVYLKMRDTAVEWTGVSSENAIAKNIKLTGANLR